MQQVIVNVKDDTKLDFFFNLINNLDFVEIKHKGIDENKKTDKTSIKNLFGIWKDRDIDIYKIRDRAWR